MKQRRIASKTVVTFNPTQQAIVIALPEAKQANAAGKVHLYRPSDARLDLVLPMQLDAAGGQRLDAEGLSDGLWRVRLSWKQNGQDYYVDQPVIVARARN